MDANRLHALEAYDYVLPKERIAQVPARPRDHSRLLQLSRAGKSVTDGQFFNLPNCLRQGDLLVINNTRVIPARLQSDHGEVLLVRPAEHHCWDTIVHPGKRFKPGTKIEFPGGVSATVLTQSRIGRILHFEGDIQSLMEKHGRMPLPPYIEREAEESDRRFYQTIYAKKAGSVAAPTAGLHFTNRVFEALKDHGVEVARITLNVGPGTFRPVKTRDITAHQIDPEYYSCARSAWNRIAAASRTIAVGTTTTRAIETISRTGELEGYTNLFIYPGFEFQITRGLLTNFHLPKSSLLMLTSAFGGYELIRNAYRHAVEQEYRFYSYGDAMLIL